MDGGISEGRAEGLWTLCGAGATFIAFYSFVAGESDDADGILLWSDGCEVERLNFLVKTWCGGTVVASRPCVGCGYVAFIWMQRRKKKSHY